MEFNDRLIQVQGRALNVQIVDYHDQEKDMTEQLLDEIHPGEILLEDFMTPMGITARQLSADIDVPASRISGIVNGKRALTADTALRLGLYFGTDARFWINLQTEYDLRCLSRLELDKIKARIRAHQ